MLTQLRGRVPAGTRSRVVLPIPASPSSRSIRGLRGRSARKDPIMAISAWRPIGINVLPRHRFCQHRGTVNPVTPYRPPRDHRRRWRSCGRSGSPTAGGCSTGSIRVTSTSTLRAAWDAEPLEHPPRGPGARVVGRNPLTPQPRGRAHHPRRLWPVAVTLRLKSCCHKAMSGARSRTIS